MPVFRKYFKIVLKNLSLLMMYVSICVSISVANTSFNSQEESFVGSTPKVAVLNRGNNSKIAAALESYILSSAEKVEIADNAREIQDALYGMAADVVVIIPENFSAELFSGKGPSVELKRAAEGSSQIVELGLNRYLAAANLYAGAGMSEAEIIGELAKIQENSPEVSLMSATEKSAAEKLAVYFSFENYAFLSIFIFMIGTIMCVFNDPGVKARCRVSATSEKQINRELLLGNSILTLSVWLLFIIIGMIIYKGAMFERAGLLMMLNSLIFAVSTTCMAQLIASFVHRREIISGVQNAVGLGLSFISGCFVTPTLLDPAILNFSRIFPSFWFIDSNYRIAELGGEFSSQILINMLVVAGFGVFYYVISLIIIKFKENKRKIFRKNL